MSMSKKQKTSSSSRSTSVESSLLHVILSQTFGPIIADVGQCLYQSGPSPLMVIVMRTGRGMAHVKKSLMVLIQHQMVQVILHPKGFLEYSTSFDHLLDLIFFPNYVLIAKRRFDESVESLIVPFMKEGVVTISQLFKFFIKRCNEESNDHLDLLLNLRTTFLELYNQDLIVPSNVVSMESSIEDRLALRMKNEQILKQEKYVPIRVSASDLENNNYNEPRDIFDQLVAKTRSLMVKDEGNQIMKVANVEELLGVDDGVYWKLNFNQFNQELRNKLIVDNVKSKYGDEALGNIVEVAFQLSSVKTNHLSPTTAPISKSELIRKVINDKICSNEEEVSDYIQILCQDTSDGNFVDIVNDVNLSIKTLHLLEQMVVNCVANIIQTNFGEWHSRVFRIICKKRNIHQNLIHELALIDRNKCKEITFQLVQQGLIKTNYYPKSTDYIPPKTFYIFTVDLDMICKVWIKKCYKILLNCNIRKMNEIKSKKSLIEKKNFIESEIAILEAMDAESNELQIQDLINSISEHDLKEIKKFEDIKSKLEVGQLKIGETLFLLQSYLQLKNGC